MRVAVMQPYFVPYAGYFRLFADSDLFVILDTVQFPRRGWVHRNRLPDAHGRLQWLTLPLRHVPRETAIRHLRFADAADETLRDRLRRFPLLHRPGAASAAPIDDLLATERGVVDYLEALLQRCCTALGLASETVRASTLDAPRGSTREERMIDTVRSVGGSVYVNAPGGRELYRPETFAAHGIELRVHAPWTGDHGSVLAALARGEGARLRDTILAQSGHFL